MSCIGGAILVDGTAEIISSYFHGNSVNGSQETAPDISGGAIAVYGKLSLSNVVFTMNTAALYGGDISIDRGGSVFWTGGSSTGMGGPLSLKANNNTDIGYYQAFTGGSVIMTSESQATIDSVSFSGGRVAYGGGVIGISDLSSKATLKNIYINDTAGLVFGAIFVVSRTRICGFLWSYLLPPYNHLQISSGDISLYNVTIENSVIGPSLASISSSCGGSLFNWGGTLTLENVYVKNSVVKNMPGTSLFGYSGGCYCDQNRAMTTMKNVSFSDCHSVGFNPNSTYTDGVGGAIYSSQGSYLQLMAHHIWT